MTRPSYHSDRYVVDRDKPFYLCPCRCGRLFNADAIVAMTGKSPERLAADRVESPLRTPLDEPADYVDPTDDPVYYPELNGFGR